MYTFSVTEINALLGGFLWPFFRITAFFLVAPLFSANFVPTRVRLALGITTTIVIAPMLPAPPAIDPISLAAAVLIAQQLVIGIALGLVMQFFFQVFIFGMQLVAMQMALGFAAVADPVNGVNTTVVAQYFLMLVMLIFIAGNGHLAMIEVFMESFRTMPIGGAGFGASESLSMAYAGSWIFLSGLLLALPAVTALLVMNVLFGVMTRAAPQLNVFSLGFPVSMMFGMFLIWATMSDFMPRFDRLSGEIFAYMRVLIGS